MVRRLRLALIGLALGAAPCAAAAHWDILWDDPPPRLSRADAKRVDALLRRAEAAYRRLPADRRAYWELGLVKPYLDRDRCRDAETWLRAARSDRKWNLYGVVQPSLHSSDRACALRMVAFLADEKRRLAGGRTAQDLYLAGALWRRLGEEAKGRAALEQADRLLDVAERDSPDPWTCRDGYCISQAWETRLSGLRAYHGTPLYAPELRRLTDRAVVEAARRLSPDDVPTISEQLFGELMAAALREGVDDVAVKLASRDPASGARTLARARMTALFDEHRFSEGTMEWIEAGPFDWWNMRGAVAVDPRAFHHWRRYFREWNPRWSDLLVELARGHMKLGFAKETREAIAALREQAGTDPTPEAAANLARALGIEATIEAMTDLSDAPVAKLAPRLGGVDALGRELAYAEVAAHQARLGRWREFDRAIAAVRGMGSETELLSRLPCLAREHPPASLRQALDRAAPGAPARDGIEIDGSFWCLIEARNTDAAVEVAGWERKPAERARMFAAAADSDTFPGGEEARRRLADLALAEVRANRLWTDQTLLQFLAGGYERLGDKAMVEHLVGRTGSREARFDILLSLLRTYRPHHPKLEWIYGFARNASY